MDTPAPIMDVATAAARIGDTTKLLLLRLEQRNQRLLGEIVDLVQHLLPLLEKRHNAFFTNLGQEPQGKLEDYTEPLLEGLRKWRDAKRLRPRNPDEVAARANDLMQNMNPEDIIAVEEIIADLEGPYPDTQKRRSDQTDVQTAEVLDPCAGCLPPGVRVCSVKWRCLHPEIIKRAEAERRRAGGRTPGAVAGDESG